MENYELKYKEALERMKSWARCEHPECFTESQNAAEFIFPELKGSEEERIRRNIIAALKGEGYYDCDLTNECIAWVEKQGEPNPYSGVSFEYNGHTWGMCARDNGVEILVDGEIKERVFLDNKPQGKTALEAIKEEKVDNQNCAKPVDYENAIIVQRDFAPKEEAEPKILGIGVEHASGVLKECLDKNKELKKNDNEIEIPFGAKDSELHEVTYFIPKGFHAEIDDDKVVIKQGEQKSTAWSDQDEENLQYITGAIMAADYYTLEDKEVLCQWVESLKYRVQPQTQQWKTDDYERLKRISQFVWNNRSGDTDEIYQQEQDVKWLMNQIPHSIN